MIHYGKETRLHPGKVVDKAKSFFGQDGLGLEITDEGEGCIRFEGGGGYVSVVCCNAKAKKRTDVDLEAREWEYQVKEFIELL
jgi:hypothetical protein